VNALQSGGRGARGGVGTLFPQKHEEISTIIVAIR